MKQKLAIIGGGISGLTVGYKLQQIYDITLYEKDRELGGHAKTLTTPQGETLDLYVINFNTNGYQEFFKLMKEIGCSSFRHKRSIASMMSYEKGMMTSCIATDPQLFWRRRWDFLNPKQRISMGEMLRIGTFFTQFKRDYNRGRFTSEHLQELYRFYPQYSDLIRYWFIPSVSMDTFNVKKLRIVDAASVVFKKNSSNSLSMFTENVSAINGVKEYIDVLASKISIECLTQETVNVVQRTNQKIKIISDTGEKTFDKVIFAIESFQSRLK